MIISFDGNVFTGKTTLINKLALICPCDVISEHSDFIDSVTEISVFGNNYMNEQLRYIGVDKLRKQALGRRVCLLDRSFVSMSAHVYALFIVGSADIRNFYIQELKRCLANKEIIVPSKYINLVSPHSIAKQRFDRNQERGTDKAYIDRKYFTAIEKFNSLWARYVVSMMVDTNDKHFSIEKILDFILTNSIDSNTMGDGRILSLTSEIMKI
ncbi:deoxynucleoside kinase [Patescibacteria group bacterium]|nr:deoxynucleoside kinase [Patescibacteria group bacterium]